MFFTEKANRIYRHGFLCFSSIPINMFKSMTDRLLHYGNHCNTPVKALITNVFYFRL